METSTVVPIVLPPKAPPPIDHLVAILSELTSASERMTDALGTLARNMERVDHAVEGLLENGKEMKKIHYQLGILVGQVRSVIKGLGPLELEVSSLRDDQHQVMQKLVKLETQ
jgi:hypothetical protein